MPTQMRCPACHGPQESPPREGGQEVVCPYCGQQFAAAVEAVEVVPPSRPRLRRRLTRRRRGRWLLFGGLLLAVFASCGLCGGLGYLFYVHEIEEPVTEAEKAVLVTLNHLRPWMPGVDVGGAAGSFRHVRHLDGSREVTYECHSPEGAADTYYLHCSLTLERKLSDAQMVYLAQAGGLRGSLAWFGGDELQQEERNDLFRWGDQSRFVVLRRNGAPVGNTFTTRKGARVYLVVWAGPALTDAPDVRRLLAPVLQRVEQYRP